jgi:hypothetical protein
VSAQASPRERNPAFLSVIAASVFSKSRVERANRSSRDHQHVAGVDLIERASKLAAVSFGSARGLTEHLLASSLDELRHLSDNALAIGGYAGHTRISWGMICTGFTCRKSPAFSVG